MKRIGFILSFLLVAVLLQSCGYNDMVEKDEAVSQQWADVQTQYQRRADLIPNLVNTVKGAANFEQSTLTKVIEARAKATSMNIDASNLTPEKLQEFQAAQGNLRSALGRLMVVVEKYPDLKSNQNFLELQNQLEGTENRIKMERDRFNGKVNQYNKHIKVFPNSLLAGVFGFEGMDLYSSSPGSENAVEVNFDFNNKE